MSHKYTNPIGTQLKHSRTAKLMTAQKSPMKERTVRNQLQILGGWESISTVLVLNSKQWVLHGENPGTRGASVLQHDGGCPYDLHRRGGVVALGECPLQLDLPTDGNCQKLVQSSANSEQLLYRLGHQKSALLYVGCKSGSWQRLGWKLEKRAVLVREKVKKSTSGQEGIYQTDRIRKQNNLQKTIIFPILEREPVSI